MMGDAMEKILISACLLGEKTRYDGRDNLVEGLMEFTKFYDVVPFCPEVEGGMSTPRIPSEIRNGTVISQEGEDVTRYFEHGARKALNICSFLGIRLAILKDGSPSCGTKQIHNGRFNGGKVNGMGVTAARLKEKGIKVLNEEEGLALLSELLGKEAEKQAKRAQKEQSHGQSGE